MALGLRIVPLQGLLTARALHGLDRDDHVDFFHWHQGPALPLMTGLPSWATSTTRAARPCHLGRIRRGRLGGIARVAPQPLGQLLDRRFQLGHFCPQLSERRRLRQNHLLGRWRRVLPELRWQGCVSIHRVLTLPPSALQDKDFLPHPRERLRSFNV
jgi:hypothetical protein